LSDKAATWPAAARETHRGDLDGLRRDMRFALQPIDHLGHFAAVGEHRDKVAGHLFGRAGGQPALRPASTAWRAT